MLALVFWLPAQVLKAQGISCTNPCIVFKNATNINVQACTPCSVVNYGVTASDSCCPGGVTLTFSPTNGSCFPQGVTEVTCTANDQCGNCNTTNFFVGVACPHCTNSCIQFQNATNIVVNHCTACTFVTYPPITATDTCGCSNSQVTLAFFPTNGSCFPQGTNPVTCFATDPCGNCNVTNFLVIVQCTNGCIRFQNYTNEVVVNSCSSCAGAVYPNITATNVCCPETPVTVTFNPPPGNFCFPQGTNVVTVTATGGCNLSATTNFSVIVQCPTNTCTNSCIQFQSATNLTVFSCSNCTTISYPLTAMDTCCTDQVALTFSPTNGSCFAQGTTLVTCTANDQCGHCNTTNFTVTILCPCTTNYVGNSLTPGNIDDQDYDHGPLVILGEYNPTGPNPSSATLLSSGTIQDVKFYGGSLGYKFTLYALSYNGTGPHPLEQQYTVVASQSFSGPAAPASLITLPVSPSFTVNAGNLLAFAGWGPFYPQTNNDALNSDATYEDSTNVNSYIATPPGGAGTEFIVGVYTDSVANYEYINDFFGNQGRTYRFGVDVVSPCSNNCIQFQNATNILVNNCGNCVVVNYALTATDACCSNGVGLTFNPTNGSCFPQGTTVVTCTATDACGFSSTTNFSVTVQCPPPACVETNGVKYVQGPNLNGLDVWNDGPWVLADDFICTNAGPISDIHIWGSWNKNMALPGSLTFTLAVYSDVPISSSNSFSHPGTKLWSQVFAPEQYAENAILPSNEQFFDPGNNQILGGDTVVWYYCFYPTNLNQTGSLQFPTTYWLMAYAQLPPGITNGGQGTNFEYGWKDTTNVQHDISVWAQWPGSPPPANWPWVPNLMNGTPFDLAFKLTTPTNPCEISVVCAPDKSVQCGSTWNFDPPAVQPDPCCTLLPVPVLTSAVTNITCPESITATWTITDCVGTVTYCSQNVTLTNPPPPSITCSNIIAYTCTSNLQVFWPITVTDCSGFTNGLIINSTPYLPGTFFNANTTNTVNISAIDPCGNSNACSFTVTVLRPPVGSLTIVTNGTHSISVTWTNGAILQSSTNINGVWTDVPGASSPFTTNTGPPDVFFRLRCQSP